MMTDKHTDPEATAALDVSDELVETACALYRESIQAGSRNLAELMRDVLALSPPAAHRRARSLSGLGDDCAKIVEALRLVLYDHDLGPDGNYDTERAALQAVRSALPLAESLPGKIEDQMDGNPELAAIRVGLSAALSTPVTEGPMVIGTDFAKNGSEATVYWPSPPPDCTDKESCARHGQCMYLGACSAAPVTEKDQSNDH